MLSIEARLHQALETINFYERLITSLREALRQYRLLDAQIRLEERIAALPTTSQERLRAAFPGQDLAGLREAINVERKRL